MIELIGVPFDLCGHTPGSRLGPSALRFANILKSLRVVEPDAMDGGDIEVCLSGGDVDGLKCFEPFLATTKALQAHVITSLVEGRTPVVLGGDHSIAMGSISAAMRHFGDGLAVLWIDAHADMNTPDTSPSGNIHGMPLAALMGEPSTAPFAKPWAELMSVLGPTRLRAGHTAWFGLRDVDRGERDRVRRLTESLPVTMYDIDRNGIVEEIGRLHEWLVASGASHLWISFDVDALDPILAPGTGTAVRGGLTYREGHLTAELLCEHLRKPGCPYKIAGVDVVEVNPLCDTHNETAMVTVEWLASLFGKTILGVR